MSPAQADSLKRLWALAQGDHGGANVAAKFLLGLYNGERFRFDLTELRRLDSMYFRDVLNVLALDWQPSHEVHVHLYQLLGLPCMGIRFELLACRWRMKGRCTKEGEQEMRAKLAAYAATGSTAP